MALIRPAFLLLLLLSLAFAVAFAAAASTALDASPDAGWGLASADPGEDLEEEAVPQTTCGSGPAAGECGGAAFDDEDDATVEATDAEEMGANVSRRGLIEAYPAGRMKFISYAALAKDRVPCSRRGHSYYNCRRMKRANPYRRGCSMITHCARILR